MGLEITYPARDFTLLTVAIFLIEMLKSCKVTLDLSQVSPKQEIVALRKIFLESRYFTFILKASFAFSVHKRIPMVIIVFYAISEKVNYFDSLIYGIIIPY